jgi:DNA-binding GntR family transcriptional regulator
MALMSYLWDSLFTTIQQGGDYKEEIKGFYEIRLILEIGTIGKAIRRMTEEKLLRFQQAKAAWEGAIGRADGQALYLLDAKFHASLVAMAGNQQFDLKIL